MTPGRPPDQTSLRQRILDLLSDGRPRTSTEVLRTLAADLDAQIRDRLHDLAGEDLVLNWRPGGGAIEGLWQINHHDELRPPVRTRKQPVRRNGDATQPIEPRAWHDV